MPTILELSNEDRKKFISSVVNPGGATLIRRQEYEARVAMLKGRISKYVRGRVLRAFEKGHYAERVNGFVTDIFNPMRRFACRVAVAYKHGARRRLEAAPTDEDEDEKEPPDPRSEPFSLEIEPENPFEAVKPEFPPKQQKPTPAEKKIKKELEEKNRKLTQLCKETKINLKAKTWNQFAWGCNTVIVIPVPYERNEEKRIRYQMITGDVAEVWKHEDDPYGDPEILGYKLAAASRFDLGPSKEPVVCTLDSEAWRFWDAHSVERTDWAVEHGLGFFPGSVLRMTDPIGDDYWDPDPGIGIVQCGVEVGYIAATMGWIRKAQNRQLLALFAEQEGTPEQQSADPEGGLHLNDTPGNADIKVIDFNQPPDDFLKTINALQNEAAEVHIGVPSSSIDPDPTNFQGGDGSLQMAEHEALNEIREDQIEALTTFEHDLAWKTHAIAEWFDHPLALDPEEVKELFRVKFPPLRFLATPESRLKVAVEATKFGVTDQVEFLMQEHPDIDTEEEALARIKELAERRAELDDLRASRNMPADPTQVVDPVQPGDGLAQEQGRAGGMARLNGAMGRGKPAFLK